MLANILKVAFRNLRRQASFSALNIIGLTLGLTACLLIALFVRDEYQYDTFLPDGDQVYRIYSQRADNEGTGLLAVSPPMVAPTLKQEFPEVESVMRILMLQSKFLIEAGTLKAYEESGLYVDSTFFQVLPLPFKYGTPDKALNDPSSIVLSAAMARQFFGADNPMGKQVLIDKQPFQVTGVFDTGNEKFHLAPKYLIPLRAAGFPKERMENWGWQQFYTYFKLKKGASGEALQAKFQEYVRKVVHPQTKEVEITDLHFVQPLSKIHLYSSALQFDLAKRGNITYVRALSVIALFILLIACFNFVNLATARSVQRAREVGVRKTIGASRQQLMVQFIAETVLLTTISILISVLLTWILLPWLNQFTGKDISIRALIHPVAIAGLLLLSLLLGILAGFYPALVLSGFVPVKVLKGSAAGLEKPGQIPWLRHGLVVVQFSLSVLLIISALVVYRQVNYLHQKDLGFEKDQLLFFPMRGDNLYQNQESFRNELQKIPGVSSVSIGYGFPGDAVAGDGVIVPRNGEQKNYSSTMLAVDYDYIPTLGLQVIAGRGFSKKNATDKDAAFMINETAVRELGFGTPEKAIGQTLLWPVWDALTPDSMKRGQVIGVVKDFHYKSLYEKVETAVLQIYPPANWKVAVKLERAGISGTVKAVEAVWNRFSPEYPMEYRFLDENFTQMYQSEDKLRTLLWIFTAIAIFVGCLGLFGLAAYSAVRRIKEIGIRKVLGATSGGLVVLLSKDFVKLVLISLVLASPLAWYLMHQWLEDFPYRIQLSWWIFVLAGLIAICIALITVSFQAVRAALSNPVKNLRTE